MPETASTRELDLIHRSLEDMRAESRADHDAVRTEIAGVRTDVAGVSERVARVEAAGAERARLSTGSVAVIGAAVAVASFLSSLLVALL